MDGVKNYSRLCDVIYERSLTKMAEVTFGHIFGTEPPNPHRFSDEIFQLDPAQNFTQRWLATSSRPRGNPPSGWPVILSHCDPLIIKERALLIHMLLSEDFGCNLKIEKNIFELIQRIKNSLAELMCLASFIQNNKS